MQERNFMNKIPLTVILSFFAITLVGYSANAEVKNTAIIKNINEIAPYPEAEAGYTRSAIFLPEMNNEQDLKVEIMIGKEMTVDCNQHRLSGTVTQQDLKGWGYQYYVVSQVNKGLSTMMLCAPDYKPQLKFVTLNSDLGLIDYNSRLPIVIYTPKDVQVKYRVWSASDKIESAVIE